MGDDSNYAPGHCFAGQCYGFVLLDGPPSEVLCNGSLGVEQGQARQVGRGKEKCIAFI